MRGNNDIQDNEFEVKELQELLFQTTKIEEELYENYYFGEGYVDEMDFRSVPIESYLLFADLKEISKKWRLSPSDQASIKLPNPILHKLKFLHAKSKNGMGRIYVIERKSLSYGTTRHFLVRAEQGFFIHLEEQTERSTKRQ